MAIITAPQFFNVTLPMILLNSTLNGCQIVWEIDRYCQMIDSNSAPYLAQAMELYREDGTITPNKFLNEFVKNYTVNYAAFDIFASTTRTCVKNEAKHNPISNTELWNLLECMLIPADKLGNAFGCTFLHPLM